MKKSPIHATQCIGCLTAGLIWIGLAAATAQAAVAQQSGGAEPDTALRENDNLSRPDSAQEDRLRRVQTRLDDLRASHSWPGATAAFVLADGSTGAVATGISHKGSKRAMQPSDRMFSGSIGKTYVSALLLELLEEGRVKLDTKISHWLGKEEWFSRLPNAQDLTLRMMLNHTSGFPRHLMLPETLAALRANPQKVWKPEELLAFVLDKQPLFAAGEGWSYADTNYIVVGMIIEKVTGRTYYQELTDRILRPLKLDDTSPTDRPCLRGLISGYTTERNMFSMPAEVAADGCYAINPQFEWTGGGLVSTASDLARWAWLLYGGKVLSKESLEKMTEGEATPFGPNVKYGLGVFVRQSPHGPMLGHLGFMPGYISAMGYYREHNVAVAYQINTDVGVRTSALWTWLDELAGEVLSGG